MTDSTPWGRLLGDARTAHGLTPNAAATLAGCTRNAWIHVETGLQGPKGKQVPCRGSAKQVAHMADAVRVTPEQLREVDRADAADILQRILDERDAPARAIRRLRASCKDVGEFIHEVLLISGDVKPEGSSYPENSQNE